MLTIAPQASAAIITILASAEGRGRALRLTQGARDHGHADIGLAIVERATAGDAVITLTGGADVFVDPEVAALLEDQELDALISDEQVTFSLQPRQLDGHEELL